MSLDNSLSHPGQLDSDLLRTFLAIAKTGSFSKGAERIFRSQSAVSLQVKRLEGLLGRPLFERHARGVLLTPTGEKLQPLAQRVVDLLDSSIGALRSEALVGSLSLGIPDEFSGAILPDIVARFARDHPQVELAVPCGFSADFPEALANGELDLAVHAVESAPSGSQVLLREKTLWAGARRHAVQELDTLPVALFDRACWWRDRAIEALEARGSAYRIVYSSESVAGVAAAIEAGAAVGLLGESALTRDLQELPRSAGFPDMPESLLVLESRPGAVSPPQQAMADAIADAFSRRQA